MRLIDADKLKAHYAWWDFSDDDDRRNKHIFDSIVDLQPTADVVEVVRCKECKHYNEEDEFCIRWADMFAYCDWEDTKRVYPDGFCSFGERRDDGEIH